MPLWKGVHIEKKGVPIKKREVGYLIVSVEKKYSLLNHWLNIKHFYLSELYIFEALTWEYKGIPYLTG